MLLADRTAIVTGAASKRGLGRATARMFAEHGCRVAILDLDEAQCAEAAGTLTGKGHLAIACNVVKKSDCLAAVERAIARHGKVDILVNNAGITGGNGKLWELDPATWRRVVDVNLIGPYLTCRALVPHMIERAIMAASSTSPRSPARRAIPMPPPIRPPRRR